MDNVKRYTSVEVRFSTQGGSFVRAEDFEALYQQVDTLAEWYANALNGKQALRDALATAEAELVEAKQFQPIGEACLTNRDELRAMLGLSTPGENLHEFVKALHQDALRYRFVSKLAWYVERAAQVYDLCNVNSNWAGERGSPDEGDVEDAIDDVMRKGPTDE